MGARWLETRDVPIASLERFPGNARRGNVGEIRKSIRRHGQYRSLVVRSHDGRLVILAGNHTADALEAEGRESARCELIECNDDEARRINLGDNKIAEDGSYDDEALAALLASLDGDFEGTGWTGDDLDGLLAEPEPERTPPDSADLPNDGEDRYREQYGVIVICATEADQEQAYGHLQGLGYDCRVVTT